MKTEIEEKAGGPDMARRSFLRYAGVGAASVGLLATAACHKDHPIVTNTGVDIGSGDIGILNFAYALEQLEAAFYIQVIATPYANMPAGELALLTEIRDHEVLHRNFFKAALGPMAIKALTPDFSSIKFSDRTAVLTQAAAFEDTGVTAYDGAGYLIKSADYLTLAGKIVSVEARHASLIRNLLTPGSFVGNQVDASSVNKSAAIKDVLPIANTYLKTKVSAAAYGYTA